jgi:hypothetical protein
LATHERRTVSMLGDFLCGCAAGRLPAVAAAAALTAAHRCHLGAATDASVDHAIG